MCSAKLPPRAVVLVNIRDKIGATAGSDDKVVLVPRHPSFMHFEPDRRSPEPLLLQREKLGADADRLPVPLHFGQQPPKHLIGAAERDAC
jgi:hypothetical protein